MAGNRSNTSFIPGSGGGSGPRSPLTRSTNTLVVVAVVLVIISLGGWGGLEAYQAFFLDGAIEQQKRAFQQKRGEQPLASLARWDTQFRAAEQALEQHVAPSILFRKLEQATRNGVRWTSFRYSLSPEQGATVSLSGEAHNYATVLAQRRSFTASPFFTVRSVQQPQKQERGENRTRIVFGMELGVSPEDMRYSKRIRPDAPAAEQSLGSATGTATSGPTGAPPVE